MHCQHHTCLLVMLIFLPQPPPPPRPLSAPHRHTLPALPGQTSSAWRTLTTQRCETPAELPSALCSAWGACLRESAGWAWQHFASLVRGLAARSSESQHGLCSARAPSSPTPGKQRRRIWADSVTGASDESLAWTSPLQQSKVRNFCLLSSL